MTIYRTLPLRSHMLPKAVTAWSAPAAPANFAMLVEAAAKAGGYRTVHYFGGDDVPIFLLALIDKGEKANLTKAERNQLAKLLPRIAEAYRAGMTKGR